MTESMQKTAPRYQELMENAVNTREECPGVVFVFSRAGAGGAARGYYIVDRDCAFISDAAKAYGAPCPDRTEKLVYEVYYDANGSGLVRYEIERWRVRGGLPLHDGELIETALFNMRLYPAYFGRIPVPSDTPCGRTTRSREIVNGIVYLETETGARLVSIAYPLWAEELPERLRQYGSAMEGEGESVRERRGYLFFAPENACLPLFYLSRFYREITDSPLLRWRELMNAVWVNHPDCAAAHNARQADGAIGFTPELGTDYLRV